MNNLKFYILKPSPSPSFQKMMSSPSVYSFHIYPKEPFLLTTCLNLIYFTLLMSLLYLYIYIFFHFLNFLYYFSLTWHQLICFPTPFGAGGKLYFRCISSCSLSSGGEGGFIFLKIYFFASTLQKRRGSHLLWKYYGRQKSDFLENWRFYISGYFM